MKTVFIGGTREVKELPLKVRVKINSIITKGYNIVIGDAYGADSLVQNFLHHRKYDKVKVYATNGKVRNNIGNWSVKNILAPRNVERYKYYTYKDIEMSKVADLALMIWDGKSRGTLNNIINMSKNAKDTAVYFTPTDDIILIQSLNDLEVLLNKCPYSTLQIYKVLRKD